MILRLQIACLHLCWRLVTISYDIEVTPEGAELPCVKCELSNGGGQWRRGSVACRQVELCCVVDCQLV